MTIGLRCAFALSCLLLSAGVAALPAQGNQTKTDPAALQALVEQGKAKALAHEWGAALPLLERVLQTNPMHLEGLRWRGHTLTGLARYADALKDLDAAIEIEP